MSNKHVNISENANLTPYARDLLNAQLPGLPNDMAENMEKEAEALSAIGVSSEEDHKDFIYVLLHARKIAEDISGRKLTPEEMSKVSCIVFSNRVGKPIDTIFNFYRAVGSALHGMGIPIKKMAYPTGQSAIRSHHPRNVKKWMESMRAIYFLVHEGAGYDDALNHVVAEWDVMEKIDFQNWMRFYQEGAHEKYKTAGDDMQYLQLDGDGAPIIPMDVLRARMPTAPPGMPNMERIKVKDEEDDEEAAAAEEERLEARDKKVRSIGSRFRSLLKLLSDKDVQETLDGSLDVSIADFIKQIQDLQRYILLIPLNKRNASTIEDLIIQRGNRLVAQGFPKAGALIKKLAQEAATPPPPPVEELEGEPGKPEGEPKGKDEKGEGGDTPPPPTPSDIPPSEPEEEQWVQDFKDNLNNIHDDSEADDLSMVDDIADITVEAQALPPEMPAEPPIDAPVEPPLPEEELLPEEALPEAVVGPEEEVAIEVGEPEEPLPPPKKEMKEIGDLEGVTVSDIVDRLERVSNILKNREIPRELAWIDFMLDKVGLASYFPELAEATKSALESNQYMSTRVESMLSALRGSMEPEEPIELATTEEEEVRTEDTIKQVRENLEEKEEKAKAKKELREKEKEEGAAPPIPAEEVAKPISIEPSPPAPVRPAPVR